MALTPLNSAVLVAEDNLVNAEIARTLLEQLGCTVTVVENGNQALKAMEQGGFDLVLMDCHMPIMNGIEAAAKIREAEAVSSSERVPIIALTASVSSEDRDTCLANGMDDFLSKPFDKAQLHTVASRWLDLTGGGEAAAGPGPEQKQKPEPEQEPAAAASTDGPEIPVLDQEIVELLRELEGPHNAGVLGRLIEVFVEDVTATLPTLRASDEDAVRKAAHTLKSSAANMGALQLAELLLALETSADAAGPARETLIADIEAAFAEVRPLLEAELPHARAARA